MRVEIRYVTGAYFPTEYRRAACAVLASAIWEYWRSQCMPSAIIKDGERVYPHCNGTKNTQSAGDWLRANARREFGRHIAARWFS